MKSVISFVTIFCIFIGSAVAELMPLCWMNDPNRIDSVRIQRVDQTVYVELSDLANHLGFLHHIDQSSTMFLMDLPVHRLIFTAMTPFVWV
ncbi:MAG: hypothetical protein P9M15_03440, partial [Candidatus Electryoneaceae bacterium]|nr:hypothetical protein [Candidatus Electryoneaceae bacterium]